MNISEELKYQLQCALKWELPGEKSHVKMTPPGRKLTIKRGDEHLIKKSSVLILLYPWQNNLFCCLIKRPETMKFHPGQIAFPGGKVDQNDSSALAAALREANEEVGINPTSVEIIGKLSGLYVSVSNFHIAPFVGWYKTKPNFIQNIHEVDRIINFPLLKFINLTKNTNTDINTYTGKLNVPCFFFKEEIIWGATAMILTELFDVIKQLPAIQELH